jgi:hypothetical protein
MQHSEFNSNTFFNRLNALPGARGDEPHVWRPRRRSDHPAGLRRPRPRVLLLNQEEVYGPIETARGKTIIRQSALNGDFTYGTVQPFTTRNVLAIAAANGQVSAYDPTVKALLESIRTAATQTGTISEVDASPNTASYNWLVPNKTIRHTPTTNITVNLSPKNRLQGSYYWQRFNNTPDTVNDADQQFPGFPAFGEPVVVPHDRVDLAAFDLEHRDGQRSAHGLGVGAEQLLRQHQPRHVRQPGRIQPVAGLRPERARRRATRTSRKRATRRTSRCRTPSTG